MATVLSMVASSCIPPMAITAAKNRRDGSQAGYLPVRSLHGVAHVHRVTTGLPRLRRRGTWLPALRH